MTPEPITGAVGSFADTSRRVRRVFDAVAGVLDRNERGLWALAVATLVGDLTTTLYGIRIGLAESNPAVVATLAATGTIGFLALKLGALAVGRCLRRVRPQYGAIAALGLALPWGVATAVNVVAILGVA